MPRYHFNVHDGKDLPDQEGLDLPSKEAAWSEAVLACGEMLKDSGSNLRTGEEWRMELADGQGRTVFTLRFIGTEHGLNA